MKKLILIAASVMIAGLTQAATVNWNSGALMRAGENGGWGTAPIKEYIATELAVKVFMVDADTYNAYKAQKDAESFSQKDVYAAYKDGTADWTGGTSAYAVTAEQTGATTGTSYYAVVLYTYTDTEYGDMYMATIGKIDGSNITKAENKYDVDNIGTSVTEGWQAVPEPTSGLLLLVGGALLALKRKRA